MESVIEYDERRGRQRDLCERNQPSSSPSVRVLRFILPVLTHRPVNRPTAQLNATTCYPRVSAYASLGLISSDKPNISGEFKPFGLTCRLTSNYPADCMVLGPVASQSHIMLISKSCTSDVFISKKAIKSKNIFAM